MMMPAVDSAALLNDLWAINQDAKIIVTSGLAEQPDISGVSRVLQKPFHAEDLLRAVQEVLDESASELA